MAIPIESFRAKPMLGEDVSDVALLRLLQLCSPALPIGAFAYSQALEQAVELRWVDGEEALEIWLKGLLHHNLAWLDLPLLGRHYRAWESPAWQSTPPLSSSRAADRSAVVERVRHWGRMGHALRDAKELHAEDQHLGSALARLLAPLGIPEAELFAGDDDATFVGSFALAAARWNISLDAALSGFAFSWLENQVSAATRLIPLGQVAGQRVLSRLMPEVPKAVAHALGVDDDSIGNLSAAASMASAWHERQYTRLFRS